ncbi:hypothetical protein HG536_0H03330 [Torulaspora globosa]|uniref:Uncharacterized protein n=1 Tax=Torulaspora globosa TaxID=48254 RepID=A0A7G3ZN72_9SACH|nr:uncharacterized protein HG536_0H03330 [Torulaspora globosa]QLL34958.1 hypothetical protein HG536_0H03330 [Torulaspora globosa]
MKSDRTINYSRLFSQLIGRDGQMDDTIASFLYYLFPRELFVRALSLIESCDMFIYLLDTNQCEKNRGHTSSVSTEADSPSKPSSEGNFDPADAAIGQRSNATNKKETDPLVSMAYESGPDYLHRLIVKSDTDGKAPIFVDLQNWFCSCDEYTDLFAKETAAQPDDYVSRLVRDVDDVQDFSDDRFAQLDAHSLCKQRYFRHDKVMCAHLLAYSILLRSSKNVLRYFTTVKPQVPMISVSNMDEWLKLHINLV